MGHLAQCRLVLFKVCIMIDQTFPLSSSLGNLKPWVTFVVYCTSLRRRTTPRVSLQDEFWWGFENKKCPGVKHEWADRVTRLSATHVRLNRKSDIFGFFRVALFSFRWSRGTRTLGRPSYIERTVVVSVFKHFFIRLLCPPWYKSGYKPPSVYKPSKNPSWSYLIYQSESSLKFFIRNLNWWLFKICYY